MTRQACYALAKKLDVGINYYTRKWHGGGVRVCDLTLPEGSSFDGNEGLDELHHECELDEDIWPGVYQDLETIRG
jgi:hypothetical protein